MPAPSAGVRPAGGVAVVCFVPDRGHLQPLLRLASIVVAETGARSKCWLPEEFEWLAREFGMASSPLRVRAPESKSQVMQGLARRSIFYNEYSNDFLLRALYWTPLRSAAAHELARVRAELREFAPDSIVCDLHVFPDWYRALAASCGARLVANRATGARRSERTEFQQVFGSTDRPRAVEALVETAGRAARAWFRLWNAAAHPAARARVRAVHRETQAIADAALAGVPAAPPREMHVYSGVDVLDDAPQAARAADGGETEIVLASAVRGEAPSLPPDLAAWMESRGDEPIVYVSFGTMVQIEGRLLSALLDGFAAAEVSVLWSLPGPQARSVPAAARSARLRIEETVPQTDVLRSDRVRCFVSHGGASGVLEAAVCGKPVLCIPFLWDQPYNASLVERLGAGIRMKKRNVAAAGVADAVRRLVRDPTFAANARRLAERVADPARAEAVRRWARGVVDGRDARP